MSPLPPSARAADPWPPVRLYFRACRTLVGQPTRTRGRRDEAATTNWISSSPTPLTMTPAATSTRRTTSAGDRWATTVCTPRASVSTDCAGSTNRAICRTYGHSGPSLRVLPSGSRRNTPSKTNVHLARSAGELLEGLAGLGRARTPGPRGGGVLLGLLGVAGGDRRVALAAPGRRSRPRAGRPCRRRGPGLLRVGAPPLLVLDAADRLLDLAHPALEVLDPVARHLAGGVPALGDVAERRAWRPRGR